MRYSFPASTARVLSAIAVLGNTAFVTLIGEIFTPSQLRLPILVAAILLALFLLRRSLDIRLEISDNGEIIIRNFRSRRTIRPNEICSVEIRRMLLGLVGPVMQQDVITFMLSDGSDIRAQASAAASKRARRSIPEFAGILSEVSPKASLNLGSLVIDTATST